jgi:hypothetical protein
MKYKIITVDRLCRNSAVGDYEVAGYPGWWDLEVTETGDRKFNKLLMLHELIECFLIQEAGIAEPEIDKFDAEFLVSNPDDEPGDSPTAPYYKEHQFAEKIEKLLCEEMGISWNDYCVAITKLIDKYESKR